MTLTLADLRYLFEAPAIDPMAGSHLGRSGLELVLQRLKRSRLPRHGRLELVIALPSAQIGPHTQADVQRALADHAAARISDEEADLRLIGRETRQSLKVGGLFLTACLVLAALVDRTRILPPFVQTLMRESLVIAGWVGLWHPLDLLLYSWWPNRYRISLMRYLTEARVTLKAV